MSLDIESLGFTKEELQERVIERICTQLMESVGCDEDGEEYPVSSTFRKAIDAKIKKHIDETISALADKHVLPNVAQYIENLTLQQTNQWGQKTAESITFIEYLVKRAEAYMQEKVDYSGKSKEESGSYSFNGAQTRITYLINQHLQYSIETAMKSALQVANSAISKGIQETVKFKLEEIVAGLKVQVATK